MTDHATVSSLPLRRRLRAWTAGALAAALAVGAGVPGAQAMVPHKAVYELSLAKARSSQAVNAISGTIVFTWRDVCDGWSVDYKAEMRVSFGARGTQQTAWQYSAWEGDDGKRFRFFTRRATAGGEPERRRGSARITPGEGGTATLEQPEARTVDLPADTMFPKAHSEAILERAKAGETFFWRYVFDGTGDGDGLFGVNAIILKELEANTALPIDHPLVRDQRSWRVQLAYFPSGQEESTPESEQVTRLFANGVAGSIEIDYGDFVVDAELSELTELQAEACE
ncbi:cell envelope integrity EipB family protein [Rhodovibrio sodomensis]|nr:cell envelope integrity EipB family protein [Rhodovibrio sodomensis]